MISRPAVRLNISQLMFRQELLVRWVLLSVLDKYTFGAPVNISGSRTVCVGLTQNKIQPLFAVMKEHVRQSHSVAR